MATLKKILHVLLIGLLGFLTATSIAVVSLSLTVTSRDVIKSWPADSGVYHNISDNLLALMQPPDEENEESLEKTLEDTPLDRERLNSALKTVYTPQYWQSKYEVFVDAVYDWLEGEAPDLEFTIAFNDRNRQLADTLEVELTEQLATYPRCTSLADIKDFNPLEATCLPPGVSPQAAARQFTNELTGEDSFLSDASFTEDDLDLDEEARANAPATYDFLASLPWMMAAVLLLIAVLAALTGKSLLYGLRKTGQTLFAVGLVSWLGFYIGNRLSESFEFKPRENEGEISPDAFNDIAQPFIRAVFEDFTTRGLWVSLVVVIAGTLLWLGAFIWHKAHHNDEAETMAKRTDEQKPKEDSKLPKPVKPDKK